MLQKKICMVGAFATGKTSLVKQFVQGIYSEKYQTTIGVKIDKKPVKTERYELNLVLWDLEGEDEFKNVKMSYLRGASAYLLVVDGTRKQTLEVALSLREKVSTHVGNIPFILVLNKCDLQEEWEVTAEDIDTLKENNFSLLRTSAKTGSGVEDCFRQLADKIMEGA